MSSKPLTRGKFYGLGEPGVKILFAVTHWWNDNELEIRGEERRFSTHQDLPLEDLYRGNPYEYNEAAHERLLDKGFLEKTYVARRKIDWAPTQRGRNIIRDILSGSEHLAPPWTEHTRQTGPLYGVRNESVTHRKIVLVAGYFLPANAWAFDISKEYYYGYEYYPIEIFEDFTHDFHLTTKPGMVNVGVEAITDDHRLELLIEKWKHFHEMDRVTFWIFDRRETAAKMFNALDDLPNFYLYKGQFGNPSSWATQEINHKIWRSEMGYRDDSVDDVVFTLTEVLEGGQDAFHETFKDYFSYK